VGVIPGPAQRDVCATKALSFEAAIEGIIKLKKEKEKGKRQNE
jgi:hypothetical protein